VFYCTCSPAPPSPLFPYTTLFRSAGDELYRWTMGCQMMFYAAALAGRALPRARRRVVVVVPYTMCLLLWATLVGFIRFVTRKQRSEEHTSELQSHLNLVCRLLLEK